MKCRKIIRTYVSIGRLMAGMSIFSLFFIGVSSISANDPLHKGPTFNPPSISPASSLSNDDSRHNAARISPPSQQSPPPAVSRPVHIDPPVRQESHPAPVINRPAPDSARSISAGTPAARTFTPPVRHEQPSPKIVDRPAPVVRSSPAVVAPSPKIADVTPKAVNPVLNKSNAREIDAARHPQFSPATVAPPAITKHNGGDSLIKMSQLADRDEKPGLSEIRKRLDERKNDRGNNPPVINNANGDKPADNTVKKLPDKPVDPPIRKPIERPIEKLREKSVDKPLDIKPLDKPVIDKPADKLIEKPMDKNLDKTIRKTPDTLLKNPGEKTVGDKNLDKPLDKKVDTGLFGRRGRKDKEGDVKKTDNPPPKVDLPNATDANPPAGPGNSSDKTDAFKKGRFHINPNKGNPNGPSNTKSGDAPPWTPPGDKDVKKDLKLGPKGDLNKNAPEALKHLDPNHLPGKLPDRGHGPDLKNVQINMGGKHFDERVKSGELDIVTKGQIAKKLDLADQYKKMHDGDVARRMNLQMHAGELAHAPHHPANYHYPKGFTPRPGYYTGLVSPAYLHNSFKFHYWGHPFFAGEFWYPHWNPWIAWSWGYHCHPRWDPRPIWCRPIIYEPYIVWTPWQPPVWQPLPETVSGTWVDVKPVVVPQTEYDLQLLAVRMVDPGHPEENLGPRYRVWYRNNSAEPITDPFTVMIFASNDQRFGDDLPRAGVRVTSIEAGDTQSVDIRLPIEVYSMNRDPQGQPAPFEFLHFFVDANREINDATRANNGAVVPRGEMLPVDPAAFEIDPAQAHVGGELIVAGEGFGPQPGQVLLHVGDQELQAEIAGWYDLGAKIVVPTLDLNAPTDAEVIVVRGDGAAANPLKITLLPGQAEPALEMPVEQ